MQPGCSLPTEFHQKLLECSETQVLWLSVAALLTWEVPHALQWWEVRDVALVAQCAAEAALVRYSGLGGSSSSKHGRSVSSGGAAAGTSGGYEEQHAWLVVAWALLAIEGACNVATGVPFENRCDICDNQTGLFSLSVLHRTVMVHLGLIGENILIRFSACSNCSSDPTNTHCCISQQ